LLRPKKKKHAIDKIKKKEKREREKERKKEREKERTRERKNERRKEREKERKKERKKEITKERKRRWQGPGCCSEHNRLATISNITNSIPSNWYPRLYFCAEGGGQ
jgi:hypothetical protein